jgi:hypothetical protein
MKRTINLILTLALFVSFAPIQKVNAVATAGTPYIRNLTITNNNAPANGTAETIIKFYPCWSDGLGNEITSWNDMSGQATGFWTLTGLGALIGAPSYTGFPVDDGVRAPAPVACGQAFISFKVKSTTAGTKTLTINSPSIPEQKTSLPVQLTFTTPASVSTNTTTNKSTQTQTQVAAQPTKPAVPSVIDAIVGDQKTEIKTGENPSFTFNPEKGVTFSGKTIPNGKVTLYFQSEPFNDTTTADANGVWTYILKRDLGEGEHSLETTVTDPATNQTSDKSPATKFALNYEKTDSGTSNEPVTVASANKYLIWYYVGGAILIALAIGAGGFFYLRRKKKSATVKKETKE